MTQRSPMPNNPNGAGANPGNIVRIHFQDSSQGTKESTTQYYQMLPGLYELLLSRFGKPQQPQQDSELNKGSRPEAKPNPNGEQKPRVPPQPIKAIRTVSSTVGRFELVETPSPDQRGSTAQLGSANVMLGAATILQEGAASTQRMSVNAPEGAVQMGAATAQPGAAILQQNTAATAHAATATLHQSAALTDLSAIRTAEPSAAAAASPQLPETPPRKREPRHFTFSPDHIARSLRSELRVCLTREQLEELRAQRAREVELRAQHSSVYQSAYRP